MSQNICRNCGQPIDGNECPNCGYEMLASKPFKNVISNKEYKEYMANSAIALLMNNKLLSQNELKHLKVIFAYLLYDEDNDVLNTLMKIIPPKKMFQPQKSFYCGTQGTKLLLLDEEKFNDELFKKTAYTMLTMHGVNMALEDDSKYVMELY